MGQNLNRLLQECAGQFENVPAFMYLDNRTVREVHFGEFYENVQRRRAYYGRLAQKRVGVWAYNSYEWIVAVTALLLAGKTAILLDANLPDEDMLKLCEYTDVQLLMIDEETAESEAAQRMPAILLSDEGEEAGGKEKTEEEERDGAFICFTSGTSRSAKGVVITVETLCGCVRDYREVVIGEKGQRFYLPLPYHHIYAFVYIYHLLHMGGVQCIGRTGRHIIPDLAAMRPQVMFVVPSMLKYLLEKDWIPESVQTVLSGGSYLRQELAEAVERKGVELRNLYGSSEVLGAVACSAREKGLQWLRPVGSNRFIRNEDGELGIILPHHMKEYYHKPEDTAQILDNKRHIFWTGDAGDMDADGFVCIRGRVRDMIVLENGEKVHAEDTDGQLCALPGVRDGAVIGADGTLVAVVIPDDGVSEEVLMQTVKRYNRTRQTAIRFQDLWIRREPFPRTTIGKLKRFILEQEYRKEKGGQSK